MAVGAGGTSLTSGDAGAIWSVRSSGVSAWLHGIGCQQSACVGVGEGGTTLASTDGGASWSSLPPSSSTDLYGNACGSSDTCFAVGDGGTLLDGDFFRTRGYQAREEHVLLAPSTCQTRVVPCNTQKKPHHEQWQDQKHMLD